MLSLITLLISSALSAEPFEFKGLIIGQPLPEDWSKASEVCQKWFSSPATDTDNADSVFCTTSIGTINSVVYVKMCGDLVDQIYLTTSSDNWLTLQKAVRSRYRKLLCSNAEKSCTMRDSAGSILLIDQFNTDPKRSYLIVSSIAQQQDFEKKIQSQLFDE